jgi:hypothetical protein
MNRPDTVQKDNQPTLIEDLTIINEQAAEVKGGSTATRSTELAGAVWSGVYDR